MAEAEYKSALCGCQAGTWQHLCQPGLTGSRRSVSRRWGLQTPHWGGRAQQQAERGCKNGPECVAGEPGAYLGLRNKLGNKVVVIGQEGEKACGVHGSLGSGRGEQRRRSLGVAGGAGTCLRVPFGHRSRQAGREAGRELGRAGVPWHHASWEGQAGHVRTGDKGLVPVCPGHAAL